MANEVNVLFGSRNEGTLSSANATTAVSFTGNGLAPYELLLGAFASCLHATFKSIIVKKKLSYEGAEYNIKGEKREEVPTTLKELHAVVTLTGVPEENQKATIKAMELAEKYCSISATLQLVADIKIDIIFK